MSFGQWVKLERGERRLTDQYLHSIARAFEVPVYLLLEESGSVPIVGFGGPSLDGEVTLAAGLGRAPTPNVGGDNVAAIEVRGDVMRGIATDGWIIYFDDLRAPISETTLGELSVVCMADGRTLIRTPRPGSMPGRYHLESPGAPAIFDAEVRWAAIVSAIIPGAIAKRMLTGETFTTRQRGFRRDRRRPKE